MSLYYDSEMASIRQLLMSIDKSINNGSSIFTVKGRLDSVKKRIEDLQKNYGNENGQMNEIIQLLVLTCSKYQSLLVENKKNTTVAPKQQQKIQHEQNHQPLQLQQVKYVQRGKTDEEIEQELREQRLKEINEINKSLEEIAQLFDDLKTLVEHQQPFIDTIEAHIQETQQSVQKGKEEVLIINLICMKKTVCMF
eukprot:c9985_g1_i2.p1 GENE.c9985_g1_i2~~c9985_g1_i2.p1  ORF type:complete len:208 (+),score=20.79 c9985_g1_i2:42-626(+)